MRKLLRFSSKFSLLPLVLSGLWPSSTSALEQTEWQHQQSLTVERSGIIKLVLPPTTLDAARPGLEDLRLIDASGRETPYFVERAAPSRPVAARSPKSFRSSLTDGTTQLLLETGTTEPIAAIGLATPAAGFLKAARVETSQDGRQWELVHAGAPLFVQFGATQLQLELERRTAALVRITIDDTRTQPIPFTGANLQLAVTERPAPTLPLTGARIARRDEFAGETVLTIDLGAAHVPLAALELTTDDALFTRSVSIGIRELQGAAAAERVVANGTLYRLATDGLPTTEQLTLPLAIAPPGRELLVHIANGDSPPLAVRRVHVHQHPTWLVFRALEPGTFRLLTGNPDAASPRYDLASFANTLKSAAVYSQLAPGPIVATPGYQRRDALAELTLLGGALDPTAWRCRKPVHLDESGVQQLELDLDVLARSRSDLGDVRLLRHGRQVPYLVERTSLARASQLAFTAVSDPKRPNVSRWEIKLPRAGTPLTRMTLKSSQPLFQRHVRLSERVVDERHGLYERSVTEADWSKTPGHDQALVLRPGVTTSDTLWLETDNGDNPPLTLDQIEAEYPVTRLLFKAEPGPLWLYYQNRDVAPPRYDIALVAPALLAADKHIATLAREESTPNAGWPERLRAGTRNGVLFWAALGLVVVVLLVVVAKLLPKPPTPGA